MVVTWVLFLCYACLLPFFASRKCFRLSRCCRSTNALRLADIMLERFRANAAANVSLDDQVTFVKLVEPVVWGVPANTSRVSLLHQAVHSELTAPPQPLLFPSALICSVPLPLYTCPFVRLHLSLRPSAA